MKFAITLAMVKARKMYVVYLDKNPITTIHTREPLISSTDFIPCEWISNNIPIPKFTIKDIIVTSKKTLSMYFPMLII